MGRYNEDVFGCRQCQHSVVYEPAQDGVRKYVTCDHCGAVHEVRHTIEIQQVQKGYKQHNEKIAPTE